MSVSTPIPPPLREWAQAIVGPVSERNVSHDRPNSLVWELTYDTGRAFVKLSPNPMSFARETRALREVAPGLEPGTVPLRRGADAHQQALLLSLVPGRSVKSLSLAPGGERALHCHAGSWLRHFHGGTGDLSVQDRKDAAVEIALAAAGADKHLERAGNLISAEEQRTVRWHAAELGQIGPLPAAYIHGDFQPRNWLLDTDRARNTFGAVDLERACPHAAVADVVFLTCGPWVGRLDLEQAFWNGYGRGLTAEEERALRCLSALDAASAIAWGVPNGDHEIVERGRATLARLEVPSA
ncbi:aminoglycoside phosphotransferase family protein [Streptomyces fulvoviolaceus]|uniref:aminoglycoside phosphotransferase family protein n=1 Tax=Streptomyces fulvoviolaceus TaxID=285535 RepID=UPI0021BE3765|nr:aminoglycoside phosphotransferase family protein [Streptomyces fulvoviolaceus]MCT9075305.1 aminoglycoside phosphotransferase family protein [Streptomyces fulvoviolaceus]